MDWRSGSLKLDRSGLRGAPPDPNERCPAEDVLTSGRGVTLLPPSSLAASSATLFGKLGGSLLSPRLFGAVTVETEESDRGGFLTEERLLARCGAVGLSTQVLALTVLQGGAAMGDFDATCVGAACVLVT